MRLVVRLCCDKLLPELRNNVRDGLYVIRQLLEGNSTTICSIVDRKSTKKHDNENAETQPRVPDVDYSKYALH